MTTSLKAILLASSCVLMSACDSDDPATVINPAPDLVSDSTADPGQVPLEGSPAQEPVTPTPTVPVEAAPPAATPQPAPVTPGTNDPAPAEPTPAAPTPPAPPAPTEPAPTEPTPVAPTPPTPPAPAAPTPTEPPGNDPTTPPETPLAPVSATGADTVPGDDDSPTSTESLSVAGPFIQDPTRGAGPPSVPEGLTLLLQSNDWLKFSWAPSTDDQSVAAYEVYRDGQLIATVRGDTGYEHDYRRWLSTSIIDCNYTRYADCTTQNLQPIPGNSYAYSVAAIDNEGLRSARSAEAVYSFPANSQAGVDLTGYVQVFDEEFDGTSLDRGLWKTSLPWGPDTVVNGELQYFANVFGADPIDYDPFVFTGNTLQITGIATPPELLSQANNQRYLSGVISTSDYFEMTYGYVEMQAKLAPGQGLLSTFYLFNQGFYKSKPEIDIIEYISDRTDKAYQTYHYYDSNRARFPGGEKQSSPTMEAATGVNLSADFHNYSVLWEPGLIIWYIDGVEVQRITGVRVSDEPMNIVAHMVIGSNWIGEPNAQSIPAVFEIDYIKAWQKP